MDAFLLELIDSYRSYFDIDMREDGALRCIASYHSRTEGYVLTKKVGIWAVKDDEYVLFYLLDQLTEDSLNDVISKSLALSEGLIVPDGNHRSSMLTSIIVCRTAEPKCVKRIQGYRFHRNFKFMLNGWMDHRMVLMSLDDSVHTSDRLGKDPLDNAMTVLGRLNDE